MAEIQERHRNAAEARKFDVAAAGTTTQMLAIVAQALADQEAELAEALMDESLPGQDPWTLAAWVRSGEWSSDG